MTSRRGSSHRLGGLGAPWFAFLRPWSHQAAQDDVAQLHAQHSTSVRRNSFIQHPSRLPLPLRRKAAAPLRRRAIASQCTTTARCVSCAPRLHSVSPAVDRQPCALQHPELRFFLRRHRLRAVPHAHDRHLKTRRRRHRCAQSPPRSCTESVHCACQEGSCADAFVSCACRRSSVWV